LVAKENQAMHDEPKTCKDWKGKTVIVTREMKNQGGAVFFPGERLVVRHKLRDGTFELVRPEAGIIGDLAGSIMFDPEQRKYT
jgi:hypothetical protein